MSLKFVLDSNILIPANLKRLRESSLLELCQKKKLTFYMIPVLAEEKLHFLTQEKVNTAGIESIRFLVDLPWQKLFQDTADIFEMELDGKLLSEYLFCKQNKVSLIKARLSAAISGSVAVNSKDELVAQIRQREEIKENNRKIYVEMNEEILKKYKNSDLERKDNDFQAFLGKNLESMALVHIEKAAISVDTKDKRKSYWLKYRDKRCPYFTKFIEGLLFAAWYAMTVDNKKHIDKNYFQDLQYLNYLIGVDAIISDEKHFMKNAWGQLFPSKKYYDLESFFAVLSNS
ncbi:MAG: hypothetical protein HYS08_01355 [Chlamydiae bacterium]|nr:hypothetical protein [Chlamydiota bacterium]MBI3265629.1 hypothetical protein [Chlamydiota bacterium]